MSESWNMKALYMEETHKNTPPDFPLFLCQHSNFSATQLFQRKYVSLVKLFLYVYFCLYSMENLQTY